MAKINLRSDSGADIVDEATRLFSNDVHEAILGGHQISFRVEDSKTINDIQILVKLKDVEINDSEKLMTIVGTADDFKALLRYKEIKGGSEGADHAKYYIYLEQMTITLTILYK